MCIQFSSSTAAIQDKLSMAITLQTYINHKLQAIQEQLDDIHKKDNTSNFLAEILLKSLAFLYQH
jgi:hypothetical protein